MTDICKQPDQQSSALQQAQLALQDCETARDAANRELALLRDSLLRTRAELDNERRRAMN